VGDGEEKHNIININSNSNSSIATVIPSERKHEFDDCRDDPRVTLTFVVPLSDTTTTDDQSMSSVSAITTATTRSTRRGEYSVSAVKVRMDEQASTLWRSSSA
jgi:hypothetical protein